MKIARPFVFTILLTIAIGCKKNEEHGFLLNGKVDGYTSDYIYLKYGNHIDSSLVENNIFIFNGVVPYPKKGILYPVSPSSDEQMTVGVIMLENSEISVYARFSTGNSNSRPVKFLDIDSIRGSKSQDLRNRFEEEMAETVHGQKNDSLKKVLLFNNLHEFISANPTSEMCGEYLADLSTSYNYLTGTQIEGLLKLIDTSFQENINIESVRESINKRAMFGIGNIPPEIILPDQEGKLLNRLTLNGKIVLLEFWASWCIPCRQANPELLTVYNASKNSGFEILGISIDKDSTKWKDAIKKDKINWLHVIDSSRVTGSTFNLTSIPYNLLLDREGKIISQNIKPSELLGILDKEL